MTNPESDLGECAYCTRPAVGLTFSDGDAIREPVCGPDMALHVRVLREHQAMRARGMTPADIVAKLEADHAI